jgi:hypothetical protein
LGWGYTHNGIIQKGPKFEHGADVLHHVVHAQAVFPEYSAKKDDAFPNGFRVFFQKMATTRGPGTHVLAFAFDELHRFSQETLAFGVARPCRLFHEQAQFAKQR